MIADVSYLVFSRSPFCQFEQTHGDMASIFLVLHNASGGVDGEQGVNISRFADTNNDLMNIHHAPDSLNVSWGWVGDDQIVALQCCSIRPMNTGHSFF